MKVYEYRDNYLGNLIRTERKRRAIKPLFIYGGICSESVYSRLEGGDFNVNFHVRRAVLQRMGIDGTRCGVYLTAKECAELDERAVLLESIADGRLENARELLDAYDKAYGAKGKLNKQFVHYVKARLEELDGNTEASFELYDRAINMTMPDYASEINFKCISVYEAYIICNAARLLSVHGDKGSAVKLYNKLIEYCRNGGMDQWGLCRVFPAAVYGLLETIFSDGLSKHELYEGLSLCYAAIDSLKNTGRLYFLVELLGYVKKINRLCGNKADIECDELEECLLWLYKEYDINVKNYEWYPYYIEGRYYSIENVINERRMMYGMTIEELAGTDCDVSTISRMINGRNSARISTLNKLLDKLGFAAALDSDVIVSKDVQMHALWDAFVDKFLAYDFDASEKIYMELSEKLDLTLAINRMAVEFIRIKLDLYEKKIDSAEAMKRYASILPFQMCDMGKYRNYTLIEQNTIDSYIAILEEADRKSALDILQFRYDRYDNNIIKEKQDIIVFEYILRKYSSILGNAGEYEKSNDIANEGIVLELLGSRSHVLNGFLYDIAWNDAQRGCLTERDVSMCRYAYLIARFKEDKVKMDFYKTQYETYYMMLLNNMK